jgi:hypothetical protein
LALSLPPWDVGGSGSVALRILTSALGVSKLSASRFGRFTFGERILGVQWIRCSAGPTRGLRRALKRTSFAPISNWTLVVQFVT